MRPLFVTLAVALVLAACSDVPTNPSAAPADLTLANQLYCPGPFTMVAASKDPAADNNADGFICELVILAEDKETVVATYVDNNVLHDIGECPKGFTPTTVKQGEGADRNEDGWECRATRPNGNVVIIDNRFDVEKSEAPPAEPPAPPGK